MLARVVGTQSPVTIGWENIPRVEGGPVKRFFFTWFQPVVLFALILFWYYAPNSIAKASTAIGIGIGFKVLLLVLEWVNPRYASWRLTWKELMTDLFYVGLGYTVLEAGDGVAGGGNDRRRSGAELGNVAALRQVNDDRVCLPFGAVVLLELGP